MWSRPPAMIWSSPKPPASARGDSHIIDLVDLSMYVMTSDFGAASQLEKIDMLDFADLVVVNKFEKRGGEDAVRDVRKQVQRNRMVFDRMPDDMPVFGTIASKFNDDGVTAAVPCPSGHHQRKNRRGFFDSSLPRPDSKQSSSKTIIIPPERTRYLAEIAETVRNPTTRRPRPRPTPSGGSGNWKRPPRPCRRRRSLEIRQPWSIA